jgi:hypothetical protein
MKLVIVGNRGGTNVGGSFERAATRAGIQVSFLEASSAMSAPGWLRRFNWYCRGHRPTHLELFGRRLLRVLDDFQPDLVLATGIAPLDRQTILRLRGHSIPVVNFLTDDPWNAAHRARWFLRALPEYSAVFSPRRAVMPDLVAAGCPHVAYLPFGYDPELHVAEGPGSRRQLDDAVLFVGAAEKERVAYCRALVSTGIRLDLYGDFWNRYAGLRRSWRGYAAPVTLRRVSGGCRISLCLVRRANRDGHTMRTFEAAAMGGCLLVENTSEHRELFGPNLERVVYFESVQELQSAARWLLAHEPDRRRMANAVHTQITRGAHTYSDRLRSILEFTRLPT